MRDAVSQSDGIAAGMVAATALGAYPVVRGVAGLVGGAIDASQRQGVIDDAPRLVTAAVGFVTTVKPRLGMIEARIAHLGMPGSSELIKTTIAQVDDRVQWFSQVNIRKFVEANKVNALVLLNEMAAFLVDPIREMVRVLQAEIGSSGSVDLRRELADLEIFLVRFAADTFKADISREGETNYYVRKSVIKILTIATLAFVVVAALVGVVLLVG